MKPYQSTKNGKPVKRSRWAWTGFHWFGRDDQGVSIWSGDPRTLDWTSRLLGGVGLVGLTASALLLAARQWEPAIALGPMGILVLGIAWYMRRHYAWLQCLATVEGVAADLGVDPEGLGRLAKGRDIKPRMILDGVAHYSATDLGEVGLLLRASAPPVEAILMRPAGSARTDDSILLQPSSKTEQSADSRDHPHASVAWLPASPAPSELEQSVSPSRDSGDV
jgi:hypothetical protein